GQAKNRLNCRVFPTSATTMERATGIEPVTSSLGSWLRAESAPSGPGTEDGDVAPKRRTARLEGSSRRYSANGGPATMLPPQSCHNSAIESLSQCRHLREPPPRIPACRVPACEPIGRNDEKPSPAWSGPSGARHNAGSPRQPADWRQTCDDIGRGI